MILTAGGKTDRGLVRPDNEDSIYVNEKLRLVAVADGMGGHASGETASKLAAGVIRDYFQKGRQATGSYDSSYSDTTNRLKAAVLLANKTVYQTAQRSQELSGMGTTVAVAALNENRLSYAHVGDSRIYLVRSGSIEQLTDDHSFAPEQAGRPGADKETALPSDMKNILTRAVGIEADVDVDMGELTVFEGDLLLLCTDGLYNMVSDEDILEIVLRAGNVRAASEILIDTANENGGMDNISAIVGYIHEEKKWYSSWATFIKAFRR